MAKIKKVNDSRMSGLGLRKKISDIVEGVKIKTIYCWKARQIFGYCGSHSYCIRPQRVKSGENVCIGNGVSILDFLRIETYRMDDGDNYIIKIGDNTNIEQSVHITGGSLVEIGKDCSILFGTVITDICHPYTNPDIPALKQKMQCKPVHIDDQCFIGAHSVILPGVNLGKHVIVGANSVVTSSFPDYCVIAGAPAKMIKCYDKTTETWISTI